MFIHSFAIYVGRVRGIIVRNKNFYRSLNIVQCGEILSG